MLPRILSLRIPYLGRAIPQRRLMSTSQLRQDPLSQGTILKSDSGQIYTIKEILAERRKPLLCVYRASADKKNFIIKNMIPGEFEYQLNLQKQLSACQNVRSVVDTVQEQELFIYPFLAGNLLRLSQKKMSPEMRWDVLRQALRGLADMHDRDILHNDIKPNNILVDYEEDSTGQVTINDVKISDLEDTVIVPPGKWLRGPLCGNAIWRSAESWCRSRQNQASDVFSFGIVMLYVMLNEMVFRVTDEQLNSPNSWRLYSLPTHIIGDADGLNGLLEHIGEDNPFYECLISLTDNFGPENPMQPLKRWRYIDPDLRELVGIMTNLDPTRRIQAREALQHRWFN